MNYNATYSGKITNIDPITSDSKYFTIFLENFPVAYQPGQYVVISLTINGKEYRRSYSIVFFDTDKKQLGFIVKRIENGTVSRTLVDKAHIGDSIEIVTINGFFTLPADISTRYEQIFFIAAGSGIAPIMPMIQALLPTGLRINLLYSSRSATTTIFYKELNNLASHYPNFKIDYLFSESGQAGKARLNNTLLTHYLHSASVTAFSNTLFYTCGPLDYMDTVSITLLTEGVPRDHIRKELYYNYEIEELAIPEDTDTHLVTLHFPNGDIHQLEVQYPDSILNTALKKGLKMPYSCGSGQCGSCTAKTLSGKVWMAYNEVLTDRELSQGYVLTCLGFPVEGDVELEF